MLHINLLNQRIREVHFVNHLEKPGQIKLGGNFNFHVQYAPDNKRCIATLYQSVSLPEDQDKFFLSAEIVGVFQLEGIVDDETKRDAHLQCYDQLFPYLQSAMTQLTNAAGMAGFMLKKHAMKRESITFAQKTKPKTDPPMTLPIV